MKVKTIIYEDFANYKKPSMFIGTTTCDWKCCEEQMLSKDICQNSELYNSPDADIDDDTIIKKYMDNKLTGAIVFGGLEPMLQFGEVYHLIKKIRRYTNDDIVIYTGYDKNEVGDKIEILRPYGNIIIKYGRFVPNQEPHYDKILGVNLISDNQYAERI
jgi:hypothetical protein